MNVCVYEDDRVGLLDPLTLTHPAFDLWCGTASLLDRQRRYFAATQVAALVRPSLAEVCQAKHAAHMAVNDPAWGGGSPAAVIGPAERALVHPGATVEPMVVLDTRPGLVVIDGGAVVQAFSRLEGPCYVGPHTWVVGAKVRGSSFGPHCRVG